MLLLGDNLTCVELNQHGPVRFHFLKRHSQAKIVQKEELELEVVQFYKWQSTDLYDVSCGLVECGISSHTLAYLELV